MCCAVSDSQDLPEAVRTVLKQEISRLFVESDPKSFNKNYLSKHSNSVPHRLAGTHTQPQTVHSVSTTGPCNNAEPQALTSMFLLLQLLR